jgi:hypothetical protein
MKWNVSRVVCINGPTSSICGSHYNILSSELQSVDTTTIFDIDTQLRGTSKGRTLGAFPPSGHIYSLFLASL